MASLTPDQRAAWDRWSDAKRAQSLALVALRDDPILSGEVRRSLSAAARPAEPSPESLPLPELLRWMAGKGRLDHVPQAATALLQTLRDRNGAWSYYERLCREIAHGERDPESLAGPLDRLFQRAESGQSIHQPARYFARSVKNHARESALPRTPTPVARR